MSPQLTVFYPTSQGQSALNFSHPCGVIKMALGEARWQASHFQIYKGIKGCLSHADLQAMSKSRKQDLGLKRQCINLCTLAGSKSKSGCKQTYIYLKFVHGF